MAADVARCSCSDEALIAELRRRGYYVLGEVAKAKKEKS